MIAGDRNAGRMDLGITGVGEIGAFFMSPERGSHTAALSVGGEVVDIDVAA